MFRAIFCPKHVELFLEINKTVIVVSSWFLYIILPTMMMHGQTQIKFTRNVVDLTNSLKVEPSGALRIKFTVVFGCRKSQCE